MKKYFVNSHYLLIIPAAVLLALFTSFAPISSTLTAVASSTGTISLPTACPYPASQSPKPTITVIAPNGGETLTRGTTYTIKWSTTNLTCNIEIELVTATSNLVSGSMFVEPIYGVRALSVVVPNTGTYSWTIPTSIPAGNYKIGMGSDQYTWPQIQGMSTGSFTIN